MGFTIGPRRKSQCPERSQCSNSSHAGDSSLFRNRPTNSLTCGRTIGARQESQCPERSRVPILGSIVASRMTLQSRESKNPFVRMGNPFVEHLSTKADVYHSNMHNSLIRRFYIFHIITKLKSNMLAPYTNAIYFLLPYLVASPTGELKKVGPFHIVLKRLYSGFGGLRKV